MKRAVSPAPNYAQDRWRWVALIQDIHAAVADPVAARRHALANLASGARNTWTPAAAYPGGLVCHALATVALSWARTLDDAQRDQLTASLVGLAGFVDGLMTPATVAAPSAPVESPAGGYRHPYAEG